MSKTIIFIFIIIIIVISLILLIKQYSREEIFVPNQNQENLITNIKNRLNSEELLNEILEVQQIKNNLENLNSRVVNSESRISELEDKIEKQTTSNFEDKETQTKETQTDNL